MSAAGFPASHASPSASTSLEDCRVCGAKASIASVVARLDERIHYRACECGVTSPRPMPGQAELDAVYDEGYMDLEIEGHGLHLRFKPEYEDAFARERDMTLAELDIDPGALVECRLLDVGCANGIFLHYLRCHGVDAKGIDVSSEMVAAARARGLSAHCGGVESVDASYDVVTLWDVIEHLSDPATALAQIATLQRPGAELWIQTPCTGLISEAFGERWRNFIYPQHIHLFSEAGLVRILQRHGYDVVARTRFGSGNTAGTVPPEVKRAADRVAKASGHGDTIALRARRR